MPIRYCWHETKYLSLSLNIVKALKLASLLAEFLYMNKVLDLPGIGTFRLDEAIGYSAEQNMQAKSMNMAGISFENNPNIKENPALVEFLASHTGKIKALASADLDSQLALAQQFLNIGNPFLIEGIGSLVKLKSGEYSLASLAGMPEKFKEYSNREISATSTSEESFTGYKNILYPQKDKIKWKNPVILLLIISGIALAIWGGYKIYQKSTVKNKSRSVQELKKEEVTKKDTMNVDLNSTPKNQVQNIPVGTIKFILEKANPTRAYTRFNRLKEYQWNVQMETKDSVTYKLFLLLPCAASDTSRIIDSLSLLNGRRVYVEK